MDEETQTTVQQTEVWEIRRALSGQLVVLLRKFEIAVSVLAALVRHDSGDRSKNEICKRWGTLVAQLAQQRGSFANCVFCGAALRAMW